VSGTIIYGSDASCGSSGEFSDTAGDGGNNYRGNASKRSYGAINSISRACRAAAISGQTIVSITGGTSIRSSCCEGFAVGILGISDALSGTGGQIMSSIDTFCAGTNSIIGTNLATSSAIRASKCSCGTT